MNYSITLFLYIVPFYEIVRIKRAENEKIFQLMRIYNKDFGIFFNYVMIVTVLDEFLYIN